MNQRIRTLKRNRKSGFTLVELIVVIVILAILAALLVPALLKWIDKSKRSQYTVNCRSAVTAAQATLTEYYGANRVVDTSSADFVKEVTELADVPGTISSIQQENNFLLHLTYTQDEMTVVYCSQYKTCSDHEDAYNFEDTHQGSGGSGSTGSLFGNFSLTDPDGNSITLPTLGLYTDLTGKHTQGSIFYYEGCSGYKQDGTPITIEPGYYYMSRRTDPTDTYPRSIDKFTDDDFITYYCDWHYITKINTEKPITDYPTEYISNPPAQKILATGQTYYIDLPYDGIDGKVLAICRSSNTPGDILDLAWRINSGTDIFTDRQWTIVTDANGNPIRQ